MQSIMFSGAITFSGVSLNDGIRPTQSVYSKQVRILDFDVLSYLG